MLVSHRYQFIYTKTAKTASTSVEAYFERFCLPEGEERAGSRESFEGPEGIVGFRGADRPAGRRWWSHMSAVQIRDQIGQQKWDRYFKFCVVRNPYEKAISAFEHFGADHEARRSGPRFKLAALGMTPEQRRFFHWLIYVGPPIDRNKYVIDGEYCMDDVIRFEALETEMPRLCERLGVPWQPEGFPRLKVKHRRPGATARDLYTDRSRRVVARKYAYEIERFGYDAGTTR